MDGLKWEMHGRAADPFEALAGDPVEYHVHLATSDATTDEALRDALRGIVGKSASLASANVTDGITRLVFLWDVVCATLTVAYTDEGMWNDAPHVTKCQFIAMEKRLSSIQEEGEVDDEENALRWESAASSLSARVRQLLEEVVSSFDFSSLPPTLTIWYSEQDRASCAQGEFVAHRLSQGGRFATWWRRRFGR